MTLRFLLPLVALAVVLMFHNISTSSADQTILTDIGRISNTVAPMELLNDATSTGQGPGWTQMWEVNRECIVEVLGYMPEGLSDLPQEKREHVLQTCAKRVNGVPERGADGGPVSVGLERRQFSAAVADSEPAFPPELEALDLYWGDKIEQLQQEWNQQLQWSIQYCLKY